MRSAVALLLLAGALVAPASSTAAAFPDVQFENQCQYSYDRYWRPVPMIFGGRLTNGSGTELAPGAQLAVGDTVRLEGGTVSAILPSWITTFAYESGMIPLGEGEIPVKAYLQLEATNTAEGTTGPIELNTYARTNVVLTAGGIVDEDRSSVLVDKAPIPRQSWTATGGDVQVRQGLAESMPPLPIGRNGANVNVRGSLYVDAALTFPSGEIFHLFLDCLQGEQVDQGATHTDVVPPAIATVRASGFTGAVDGTPLGAPVDAELYTGGNALLRVPEGQSVVLNNAFVRLRLTDAQRAAWFGDATSASITGSLGLTGVRSTPAEQSAALAPNVIDVPANGDLQLGLRLADTTWTAATASGMTIRGDRSLALDANVGGSVRRLTLDRISPTDPYPFAFFLRPGPPPTTIPTPTPTATPTATPISTPPPTETVTPVVTPAATPVPTATPEPTPKAGVARVTSKSLKVRSNRVATQLSCTGEATCRGTVVLRSAVKVKKKFVTLSKSVKYSVGAGKKATVRVSLSSAGKKYVRGKKRISVVLEVKPASGKTVTKKLTLSR